MPADDIDRALVRDRLASAVREAGALALHMFRGRPASWIKGASSPVSEADLAVDALLRERLLAIRDAGWLSEETEDDPARLQRAEVWVVDPIDGTRAYLAGLAEWVIAAALVRFGRPLVAALYAPVSDELFLSVAGGGATLNGANSHDWDLAAADLLVHEAGGLVTTLTGESLIYNRPDPVHGALVAAGRARHELLLGLIRDRLAEFA